MKNWNDAYRKKGIIQKPVREIVKEAVGLFKKKNVQRVLDHGFGTGRHIIFLAEKGFDVYGVDLSEEAKNITETRLKERKLAAKLKTSDIKSLLYEDNFFDAVVSIYVLSHGMRKKLAQALGEIKRVLKPGGFLVLETLSTNDGFGEQGEEIEPNTRLGVKDVDGDIPHHLFTESELREELVDYNFVKFKEVFTFSKRRNCKWAYFKVIARKK